MRDFCYSLGGFSGGAVLVETGSGFWDMPSFWDSGLGPWETVGLSASGFRASGFQFRLQGPQG